MVRLVAVSGWIVAVALAIFATQQFHAVGEANQLISAMQAAVLDLQRLKFESEAGHASWLVGGLRLLRDGESSEGLRLLDGLARSLVKFAQVSDSDEVTELLVGPQAYLESVGDPFRRETSPGSTP